MDGILIIDKPVDWTSHDIVGKMRKILKTKRIGHTGTLDPFATGVLVMLIGKATRLAQFLDKDKKEYLATVRFGFETDTGDGTGERRITNYELRDISNDEIEALLPEFRGEIEQIPPMYSAKKIEGKKLYELARKGIEVERQPVKITIYELELVNSGQWIVEREKQTDDTEHRPPTNDHCLRILCSAGTYIRTLAEDIGRKLEIGAHLAELRRTKAGKFGIEKSVTLEKLVEIVAENRLDEVLISMNDALGFLPEVKLSADELRKTQNGMGLPYESSETKDNEPFRMNDENNNLAAIGYYDSEKNVIQPRIVLV